MREQYMRTGDGFIICYSVTDRRSFDEAVAYKNLIDRVRNQEDIPVVLVGNKCDLETGRRVRFKSSVVAFDRKLWCWCFTLWMTDINIGFVDCSNVGIVCKWRHSGLLDGKYQYLAKLIIFIVFWGAAHKPKTILGFIQFLLSVLLCFH